ncbi:cupin domain-containing protein [Myxococcaceae bacterium JPH2]|nr:cupin domain-containing protein [Myxococcaceae bacterium JPH2]
MPHRPLLAALTAMALGTAALAWARDPAPPTSEPARVEPARPKPARVEPTRPEPANPAPPRYRVSTAESPRYTIAGGKGHATLMLNATTGATAASMSVLELDAGGEVPEHVHATSAELLYVQAGAADMKVNGQALRVSPGDAVYIPAGAKHSARVVTPGPAFRAVQVYAGPGPEQRFTQGPREDVRDGG